MKWLKKVGEFLFIILACILLAVGLVLYLFYVPLDRICYRRSAFQKGTKQPYELFLTASQDYKIYNHLSKKGRTFQYYHREKPYFIINGAVLFCQWSDTDLVYADGIWSFYQSEDEDPELCGPVTDILAKCLSSLPPEHRLLPARFLVIWTDMPEEDYRLAKECPCFACYDSIEAM